MSVELQSWGQFNAAGNELGIEGAGQNVRRLCAAVKSPRRNVGGKSEIHPKNANI